LETKKKKKKKGALTMGMSPGFEKGRKCLGVIVQVKKGTFGMEPQNASET